MATAVPWDLSSGKEAVPVWCSLTRARVAPFEYEPRHSIPDSAPRFAEGCACEEARECLEDDCPCVQSYNGDGTLIDFDAPAYECADACDCPLGCSSRVVQRGLRLRLEVFDTGARGLGLRTLDPIPARCFVIQYVGRLVPPTDAIEIAHRYEQVGCNYLLVLRENQAGRSPIQTFIDAGSAGNAARFINHSCEPNLTPVAVRIGCPIPCVAFFATKSISADTELCFSYGSGAGKHRCLCGSALCTGVLPFDGF